MGGGASSRLDSELQTEVQKSQKKLEKIFEGINTEDLGLESMNE